MQCVCAILPSVACLAVISTLSHNRKDFRKKKFIERKLCVFIFSTTFFSDTFLILRRIERDIISVHRSSCKVPVIFVVF